MKLTDLNYLFKPGTIAHVGASAKDATGRFNFSKYLLDMKYDGKIYPVNPKYKEMFELQCYPDLVSIPGDIDLAILAVPAKYCSGILRNIPEGKIKFVVIHTSGFGEINKNDLEDEILQLALDKGFRIIGPNCMGIYSQQGRIGFWQNHKEIVDIQGSVGIISQSGGHAINIINNGIDTGIKYNKVISLGNQADLSIIEIIEYMGNDDTIGVIGLYVEQIRDGRNFLGLLKHVTKRKPIVVWKGGVSPVGKEAAATHTGSIAGNEEIFVAAMKQAGVVMAKDMNEFIRVIRLMQPEFKLPYENFAVISPGGGNTVSISDVFCMESNLSLPRLSEETQKTICEILPEENVDVKNPVDPGAVGMLSLRKIIDAISNDSQIENILMLMSLDFLSNIDTDEKREMAAERLISGLAENANNSGVPIMMQVTLSRNNNEQYDKFRRIMINKLIEKVFPWVDGSFSDTAAVLSKIVWYKKYLELRK